MPFITYRPFESGAVFAKTTGLKPLHFAKTTISFEFYKGRGGDLCYFQDRAKFFLDPLTEFVKRNVNLP